MGLYTGTNNDDTIIPGFVSAGVTSDPIGSTPSNANDTLQGRGGDDTLDGGGGSDSVLGGDDDDLIRLGQDVLFTGSRDVLLDVGVTRTVSLTNASGTSDFVDGGDDFDTLQLIRGTGTGFIADYFNAPGLLSGIERILGTDGNDLIALPSVYTSAEDDEVEIDGDDGNDVLVGSDSTDDDIWAGTAMTWWPAGVAMTSSRATPVRTKSGRGGR